MIADPWFYAMAIASVMIIQLSTGVAPKCKAPPKQAALSTHWHDFPTIGYATG